MKVHVSDGRTLSFDLAREEDARRLVELQRDPRFCAAITAVTVLRDGGAFTLKKPTDGPASVQAEQGERGERVRLWAGDLSLSMMVHARHRAVKLAVERGRRVWRPEEG